MFRLATAPSFAGLRRPKLEALPAMKSTTREVATAASAASADIRIRRFGLDSVAEDTYSALLPHGDLSPADLLRTIADAFQDLPEFQVRNAEDERFVLTLTLKG
jgi:hypothetical protein